MAWTHQRRNRTILVLGLVWLVLYALWSARGALSPYILALVLAYLILPAVNWLQAKLQRFLKFGRAARPVAILLVYILGIGLVVLVVSLVVPIIAEQFDALWASREALAASLQALFVRALTWYRQSVPEQAQAQVDTSLRQVSGTIGDALQIGVTRTFTAVTSTVSYVLAMTVIPFWLFYLLFDQARAARAIRHIVPERYWADFSNLVRITDKVLGNYIRGQILLSLAIGVMAAIGLMLLGVKYPAVLGLIAGMFEFLPFIGPIMGMVPAVLVAAIQQPILGLWTFLMYLGIQQIENSFLAPRITGDATQLHPTIIMVVLVVGNEIGGFAGMLVAVPLTAVIRDLYRYLYMRFQESPVPPDEAMERVRASERKPAKAKARPATV